MEILFASRLDAGRMLARAVRPLILGSKAVVLGLARGGAPVAFALAEELDLPWDIFTARMIGFPGREEVAMGAIGSGGLRVIHHEVTDILRIPEDVIDAVADRQETALHHLEEHYRNHSAPPSVAGHLVILADDGLSADSNMMAAVEVVKSAGAARVIVAAPVAARATVAALRKIADDVVTLSVPESFHGVAHFYQAFPPVTDREIQQLLRVSEERLLRPP